MNFSIDLINLAPKNDKDKKSTFDHNQRSKLNQILIHYSFITFISGLTN